MEKTYLDLGQNRTAEIAIGSSTLRNQGAPNVVAAARSFLKKLDLRLFNLDTPAGFRKSLDEATVKLQAAFPAGARHWGTIETCGISLRWFRKPARRRVGEMI